MGEYQTIATAKYLGHEITGGLLQPCEVCTIGKAKQKNITKASENVLAMNSKERVFLDI